MRSWLRGGRLALALREQVWLLLAQPPEERRVDEVAQVIVVISREVRAGDVEGRLVELLLEC